MPKELLSDRKIRNLKPTAREYLEADGDGLFLRVRPTGAKDWIFVYTFGGKRRKLGFGSLDRVPLSTAREEAENARKSIAQLIDPQLERKRREEAEETHRQALAAEAARVSVLELFERWERSELTARKDGGAEVRRCFEKDVFPKLGDMAANDVTRAMVAGLLDDVAARGARIVARNLLGDIRQMYGFGIKREHVEHDPTSILKRDDFGTKVERDRVLSESEVRELALRLPAADMWDSSIGAIWIMLSTCCRVGEISQARIADIDLEAGEWRIPADVAKNGKAHTVYISEFAARHFRALIERARKLDEKCVYILPAKNGSGHVCLKSLAKQIGDRQRGAEGKPMKGRTPLVDALTLPGGRWTPHDLRRTGATMMGALGVRPDVIEKCLNHVVQNRLVRIYQRQELRAEQREAWHLLGKRLELLTRTDTENVVTLARVAA